MTKNSSYITMNLESLLSSIGYSHNEAKIYLAVLSSGLSSAQEIAARAGLPRTTAYSILPFLVNRGVIIERRLGGRKRFEAEPPSKLVSGLLQIQGQLEESLVDLEKMYCVGKGHHKIVVYEGEEAVRSVNRGTTEDLRVCFWESDDNGQLQINIGTGQTTVLDHAGNRAVVIESKVLTRLLRSAHELSQFGLNKTEKPNDRSGSAIA